MINVICTSKEGKWKPYPDISFTNESISMLPTIHINPDNEYQDILGFGAAFTDASCYVISWLDNDARAALLTDLFSADALSLNVCRTPVGQSDYGRVCYSYNDTPDDVEMKNFSIDYDREYMIPVIRQARQINPELFLFSSPWSPPGWMKTGGSMLGGWLRPSYLEAFANYYLRYLQEYEAAGIRMDALTPQNETETDQLCKMPACYWHPEFEMSFIRDYLTPLLKKHNMSTKIWIMDHNFIMWQRAKWMLDDSGLKELVDGVAFHPYQGTEDMMTMLHESHPDINMYWTEGGPHVDDIYETEWCHWGIKFTDALRNWCRSITGWNLALDEKGHPNIGPFKCGGLVTIHSETNKVTYSAQYFTFGHFSKFIKRGAKRIASEGDVKEVRHVAFVNPDGGKVVVLTNPGAATELGIEVQGRYTKVSLPEDCICTLLFDS